MEFIDPDLQAYCEAHTTPESSLMALVNRDTHVNVLKPRMLSGHLQGRFLAQISHLMKPRRILEIGTYTGYSALCLAEGLAPEGRLITIDRNEELEGRVRSYFERSCHAHQIDFRIGDARTIIPTLPDHFDLVFIDADKESNALYFDLVIDRVPSGGVILVDNVLWSGKVVDAKPDKDTQAILRFNEKVQADQRVENVLLPLRDGIMFIRKL